MAKAEPLVMDVEKTKVKKTTKQKIQKQPKRWTKILAVVFLSLVLFSATVAGAFWGYEKVYAQKFYPGVKIAGYEVGSQTPEEVKSLVEARIQEISQQKLQLLAEDKTLTPSPEEIGISFDVEQVIEQAYNIGRDKAGWQRFLEELEAVFLSKEIILQPQIEQEKFDSYINQNTGLNQEAQNATLRVENEQVIVVLSEYGSRIDLEEFKSDFTNNIKDNKVSRAVTLQTNIIEPEIDESQVIAVKPQVEELVSLPIILIYGYSKYTATAETIAGWLVLKANDQGSLDVEFSNDKINEFIDSVARKIDQKAIDRQINSETGAVIKEGRDGRVVNREKLLAEIKNALANTEINENNRTLAIEVTEQEREEKKVKPEEVAQTGGTPGLYDGKYIEINLSQQKLYIYEGENLVGAYAISTGKWSMPTPTGTRHIESKTTRAYSKKYNLYMPYWNSIGGGYGIHELPEWPGGAKEGESHLGTPVSHGCVRLGVGPAETVYNWAPIGTPVYIHK